MDKDILLDTHRPASKSDINLESPNCAGDMALDGHVLERLYDDFVFADYIDMDNGFIKHESGLVTIDSAATRSWRKARVIMTGPSCRETNVGDIILFPNDFSRLVNNVCVMASANDFISASSACS